MGNLLVLGSLYDPWVLLGCIQLSFVHADLIQPRDAREGDKPSRCVKTPAPHLFHIGGIPSPLFFMETTKNWPARPNISNKNIKPAPIAFFSHSFKF